MNILYILDPSTAGGATKAFLTLTNILRHKGVTPIVCIPDQNWLSEKLTEEGVTTIVTHHKEMITGRPGGRLWFLRVIRQWYRYRKALSKAIKAIETSIDISTIDLIHTNSTRSDVGFYLSKKYQIPHIVHVREFGDADYSCYPLNTNFINIYNKYADKFVCVSNAVKNHWENKGMQPNKLQTVYDGVDNKDITISSDSDKLNEKLRIIMSGSLLETKGQHLAIQAVSLLPQNIKNNIELDLYGWSYGSYTDKLKTMVSTLGLSDIVHFMGVKSEVHSILGNYQIGLTCSRSEGFGLVTAEYMFAQQGVIASNSGACPELIHDGETGLIFECGNAQSLADAIYKLYNDRKMLTRLSSNARNYALSHFTDEINAENIYNIYTNIVD